MGEIFSTIRRWNGWDSSTKALDASPILIEVAAGLVFRRGRLLITQRRHSDHLGGLWEFPGGKQRPGETLEECLHRELQEELGIDVQVGRWVDSITWHYPSKSVRLHFYCCTLVCHEPQPIECQAFAWVQSHELSLYSFPPADAQLLMKLQQSPDLWPAS